MSGKLTTKRPYHLSKTKRSVHKFDDKEPHNNIKGAPGQHFHIDFGFVRGFDDDDQEQRKKKTTIQYSIDGHKLCSNY